MARDFDFRPKTKPPSRVNSLPGNVKASPMGQPKKRSVWLLLVWLLLALVLVIAGTYYYLRSLKPTPVSNQSVPTSANKTQSSTVGGATTEPIVTLYDSGAGAETVAALSEKLASVQLTSQSLGRSELTLDQTYIWYQAMYQGQAEQIARLLPGKKVTLRPYNGTGPYKILVQLGP